MGSSAQTGLAIKGARQPADPTERIEQAILRGVLFPNERLVEQDLAVRFQANRGAIRTALAVLEQKNLVVRERNRGARVRAVTEKEAIEIMELRGAIEALIARHAALNVDEAGLAELRTQLKGMEDAAAAGDLYGYSSLNTIFHSSIARLSQCHNAERMLGGLCSQIVTLQYRPILEPGRADELNLEHRDLVDCIASRDPDRAAASMRRHLDNAVTALKRAISARRTVPRVQLTDIVG